jgi:hypothetical protein
MIIGEVTFDMEVTFATFLMEVPRELRRHARL